ncbi:ATP-binding protein [Halobellus rubicundus]|uniref:histidine kinase n=1 Tax=Halobellus rubicundus TaxID=2996466 RepID=A0ABD5MDI8_9EURY
MTLSRRAKARLGLAIVFGIAIALLSFHARHLLDPNENVWTFLYGILIPMGYSAGVLIGGLWLWRRDVAGEYVLRVGIWCGIGVLALGLIAATTILHDLAEGGAIHDPLTNVANLVSAGAIIGFVVGIYDTRQQIAKTEIRRLNSQLTVLNRVLRHDIRNSANVILGYADLLTEDAVTTENAVATDDVARTIKRRAADVVALGEKARDIEGLFNASEFDREAFDVADLVTTCADRIRRDYPDSSIELDLSVSEDRRTVYAHPLLESAIESVLENAIEHNDKDAPRVRIEVESTSASAPVEIRIADNGPGISRDEIATIERGYETHLDHASGLGLWLAQWIV